MISNQTSKAKQRLDLCLGTLHEKNELISGSEADKIKQEYNDVLNSQKCDFVFKAYNFVFYDGKITKMVGKKREKCGNFIPSQS